MNCLDIKALDAALLAVNGLTEALRAGIAEIKEKQEVLVGLLADTAAKQTALDLERAKLDEALSAQDILRKAQDLRASAQTMLASLEKDRAQFEADVFNQRAELQRVQVAVQELAGEAEQVRRDKVALEQEKATYRETIKAEMLKSLK
jgi:chromosome segregation ATPase